MANWNQIVEKGIFPTEWALDQVVKMPDGTPISHSSVPVAQVPGPLLIPASYRAYCGRQQVTVQHWTPVTVGCLDWIPQHLDWLWPRPGCVRHQGSQSVESSESAKKSSLVFLFPAQKIKMSICFLKLSKKISKNLLCHLFSLQVWYMKDFLLQFLS